MKKTAICLIIGVGMAACVFAAEKTTTEQCLPGYTKDLKDLALKAECRIRKIDARIGPAVPEPEKEPAPGETPPAGQAAQAPATPEPTLSAPAAPTPPAATAPTAPQTLHASWYKEEAKTKTPAPEEPGIGALIEKRN